MRRKSSLFIMVFLLLPACAFARDLSDLMPERVGELHRIQLLVGQAAQAEVDRLHGKPLEARASVVARYSRPGDVGMVRPAEVWVSRVASKKEARRQTGIMVHMMYENTRSPFKVSGRIEHAGLSVYRFTGMGQVHLIWFKEDLVYWVSANPEDEAAILDAICI